MRANGNNIYVINHGMLLKNIYSKRYIILTDNRYNSKLFLHMNYHFHPQSVISYNGNVILLKIKSLHTQLFWEISSYLNIISETVLYDEKYRAKL